MYLQQMYSKMQIPIFRHCAVILECSRRNGDSRNLLEAVASHKKALSILSISDHMFRHEELTALERQESFDEMIEIALGNCMTVCNTSFVVKDLGWSASHQSYLCG